MINSKSKMRPHSSMDRVGACGASDEGSTPSGDTNKF